MTLNLRMSLGHAKVGGCAANDAPLPQQCVDQRYFASSNTTVVPFGSVLMSWFQRIFWSLAAGGGVYVVAVLALTIPQIQRNATYAHNVNPTIYQNLSNVEAFGFHHHQVQPFNYTTPDGAVIYAWHVLPAHLYRAHATQIKSQPNFGLKTFTEAAEGVSLQLLLNDPSARVVISFHGNAGHLASSYRPATFQQVLGMSSIDRPVHVIALDYRGFGLSTGSPTEEGVIQDGVALLSLLTGESIAGSESKSTDAPGSANYIKPSQIVLMGQSFGTFVSTAVFHDWTVRLGRPSLKGLMLLASFSSLPKLLESYSIKGFTPPLLSPLMGYPWLQNWIMSRIHDKWEVSRRLKEMLQAPAIPLDITIMHAMDDWEIPWREGRRNWETVVEAVGDTGDFDVEDQPGVHIGGWTSSDGSKRVKWERIRHGGHNRIPVSEHAKVALLEMLDR